MEKIRNRIITVFEKRFGEKPVRISELKKGVSEKLILRIHYKSKTVIGIYNRSIPENRAFISFSKSLSKADLRIPEVLHADKSGKIYFVSDVGNQTLFDYISSMPPRQTLMNYYKKVLHDLIDFQEFGKDLINVKYCYETRYFNNQQILFDINRFNKYFAKKYLGKTPPYAPSTLLGKIIPHIFNQDNFFMYRDFQPRNIIKNGRDLYYLDYQSGRLGPPQYDLVSFLYSGSIDITEAERKKLIQYYFIKAKDRLKLDEKSFYREFRYFVLLRIMQILGSYCYSGLEKGITETLNKIPKAIKNFQNLEFEETELVGLKKFILESYLIHISERR